MTDESAVENMSWPFFEAVLEELGRKLNYDAVVNYAGNAFCEKSWDMIMENNPMTLKSQSDRALSGFAAFLEKADVKIKRGSKDGKGYEGKR